MTDRQLASVSGVQASAEQRINDWVRPEIRSLKAYRVNDAAGLIKLDAMENPFDLPTQIRDRAMVLCQRAEINRYPDPEARHIKSALKNRYALDGATDLLFGNGSDEIIQILAMVLGGPGRSILSVEPGFVMYKLISAYTGSRYIGVPLDDQFEINIESTLNAINEHQPALVFIAQPNNPTGNLFSDKAIRAIAEATPGVVVIDEAYTAFTDADYLSWLHEFPNLVVMRTFSKLGLAGLRFGMLFGHSRWIEEFNKARLPYNINALTQATVLAALEHFDQLLEQTEKLRDERMFLYQQLKRLKPITVYPSEANFILIRLPHSAGAIFEGLKSSGILVKNLAGSHHLLRECLRITVASRDENFAFLSAFKKQCELQSLA